MRVRRPRRERRGVKAEPPPLPAETQPKAVSDSAHDRYPPPLHAAIKAHGVELVERLGLDALGYPLSWVQTVGECLTVLDALPAETGG